jgi:hypothetical protein
LGFGIWCWGGANNLKKFLRERGEGLLEVGGWQVVVAVNNRDGALILAAVLALWCGWKMLEWNMDNEAGASD